MAQSIYTYRDNGAGNSGTLAVNWHTSGTTLVIDSIAFPSTTGGWHWQNSIRLQLVCNGSIIYDKSSGVGYSHEGPDSYSTSARDYFNSSLPVSFSISGSGSISCSFGDTVGGGTSLRVQNFGGLSFSGGDNPDFTTVTPPNFNSVSISTSNPSVYRLDSAISGVDWGIGYSSRNLWVNYSYSIDGVPVNYTVASWQDGRTSASVSVNGLAAQPASPWLKVPDDETVTVIWTAQTNIGTASGTRTQYCQPSYDAFVIEQGVNNGNPVASDLIVSNTTGSQPNKAIRRIATVGP